MKKLGTILVAAAVVSLGAMLAGAGALPFGAFGGEAHAQGQSAHGKAKGNSGNFRGNSSFSRTGRSADVRGGRGNGARQGGRSMDQPVFRGKGSARDDREFSGRAGRGDFFSPGVQKFHEGFCPRGLADKGCVPPGLQGFARGDRIPEDVSLDRIFHGDYGLPAPHADQYYGRIDNDVYLMSGATRQVLETIDLLGLVRR